MGALDGQIAIVTGAARGQGRSHAVALASEGATVVVTDIDAPIDAVPYPLGTKEELDETVGLVEKAGGAGLALVADIRDSAQVDAVVNRAVEQYGRVDILVANAGVCVMSPFEQMSDELWNVHIDTNLTGTFHCLRAVLPAMRAQGYGRVVAIASGAGRSALATLANYTASKWGVIGLVKTFALETAGSGITANVVSPSTVRTPMVVNEHSLRQFRSDLHEPTEADLIPRLAALSPMGIPWLEAETVSRAVLYFVLDEGFTTGTVLEVNLGTSANRP
jgi:SDR family mycofactocin-dependent oxidoreductase